MLAGLCRFEDLVDDLGIARTVLSTRLYKLVEDGVLERRRLEYHATEKGRALSHQG